MKPSSGPSLANPPIPCRSTIGCCVSPDLGGACDGVVDVDVEPLVVDEPTGDGLALPVFVALPVGDVPLPGIVYVFRSVPHPALICASSTKRPMLTGKEGWCLFMPEPRQTPDRVVGRTQR